MYSIDEINEMLDEIAESLPTELFKDLNGGVGLLPDIKLSSSDGIGGLYTLGEYRRDQMGRYIVLYYGSIIAVHGSADQEEMREQLRKLLVHELTHHVESLAGERGLEIKDEIRMDKYRRGL